MKTTKMPGFLCQSPAATAVCMNGDPRSMIVARRHDRTNASDRTRLIDMKYAFLAESRRLSLADKRTVTVSSLAKRDRKPPKARKVESPSSSSSSTQAATADQVFQVGTVLNRRVQFVKDEQVVVMRVALHCQGCAGKVKKHLSKMEGVTSFSIDLESKRVTVMGNVSPVGVLESISKVKRAEFWPPPSNEAP